MDSVREQRIYVKFRFKVRKASAETHTIFREAYSDAALNQTMTYKWLRSYKNGRTSTDEDWSGQTSTSRSMPLVAQVKNICGNC
jgi:hypothetical protein